MPKPGGVRISMPLRRIFLHQPSGEHTGATHRMPLKHLHSPYSFQLLYSSFFRNELQIILTTLRATLSQRERVDVVSHIVQTIQSISGKISVPEQPDRCRQFVLSLGRLKRLERSRRHSTANVCTGLDFTRIPFLVCNIFVAYLADTFSIRVVPGTRLRLVCFPRPRKWSLDFRLVTS
ncbi:unnamed protein product [Ixodes pacificus]